jgi:CheY-like chemotaxis protein
VDIGLPGFDGYEVARRTRASPETREVRLVALTGYGQEEDRRQALAAGFDWFLVKPADFKAIHTILATV